jgi:GNAT superfamily N-acetyltransferase
MQIDVEPLADPDRAYQIYRAVWRHDVPDIPAMSRNYFLTSLRHSLPGNVTERYLGLLDRVPVGHLELRLPQHENLDNVEVEIRVVPGSRRHGLGQALHAYAAARVVEHGRRRLIGQTFHPDGAAFAAAVGAEVALSETRSRLDIEPAGRDRSAVQDRLDGLLAEAWRHAEDYRLVQWTGLPPDELIDDVAYLDGRLSTDAPMGDLAVEPEKVDADRIRTQEESARLRGRDRIHSGAVHAASGRLVAMTTLAGPADTPEQMWQNITIVDPAHRGHRLGLIVKLHNLRYARERRPGLRAIDTLNASANEHMLAINRTMGFRAVDSRTHWQQTW